MLYFHTENQIIHPAHLKFHLVIKGQIVEDSRKIQERIDHLQSFQKNFFTDLKKKIFTETKKIERISMKLREQVIAERGKNLGIIDLFDLLGRETEIPSNKQQRRTSIMRQKKALYNCFECQMKFSRGSKLLQHYYDTKVQLDKLSESNFINNKMLTIKSMFVFSLRFGVKTVR